MNDFFEHERNAVQKLREDIVGWVECGKYMDRPQTFYKMLVAEAGLSDYLEFCAAKGCENPYTDFPDVNTWPKE